MAMTGVVLGTQTTINQLAANQMPDVDRYLYLLEPYQYPMLQWLYFSQGINKAEKVINANGKFSWFEDEMFPYQTTLAGGGISGGAASEDNIGLTDATWISQGDILLIEKTDQMVFVDSVDSGQVDITHIDGSTNITAAAAGSYVKKIGSRNAEFDGARVATSTKEIEKYNYCTIFKETVTTSGRRQAGDTYTGGKSHKDEVRKKVLEMKAQYERNFLFATASGTVTVSTNYRFTYGMGFLGRVTTNKVSYATTLTEAAFDAYLQQVFSAKGSSKVKRHYCGATQLAAINKFVKDQYTVMPIAREYGVDVNRYITPFGRLELVWNPMMDGKFSKFGFTVDPLGMKLRFMANDEKGSRRFRIEEGIETPGTDGKSTQILADLGIQIANEERHGILYDSNAV
ncbi:MAG: DUF5309 family protein [Syntrophomonadaceae bacterium]